MYINKLATRIEKRYMIKSYTRIWYYIFVIAAIIGGVFILLKGQHKAETSIFSLTLARLFILALFFCFPVWLLTRFKTVILDDYGVKVKFPFQFKSYYYFFSDFEYYETYEGVARGFSYQEMKVVMISGKKLIITSMANTKFQDIDILLFQKITKRKRE